MSKLQRYIIDAWEPLEIKGNLPVDIMHVTDNSREVQPGSLFVAVKGLTIDGHRYIPQAVENGATVIITEEKTELPENIVQIVVPSTRKLLPRLAQWFYGNPSKELKLIGVTGTNGKTSVVTMLHRLFSATGRKAGKISTIDIQTPEKKFPAKQTTPGLLQLFALLRQMKNEGAEFVFMEVSSHGIDQNRIAGLDFAGAVFTNLTRDHLDYHGDFTRYRDTKKKFFDRLSPNAFALVNKDDKNGLFMLQNTRAKRYTYGIMNPADFKTEILEMDFAGMKLHINGKELWTPLTGKFNAYNLTAVYGTAILAGLDEEETALHLSRETGAPGRFERFVSSEGIVAIVDYAHTPDALENVLKTVNEIRKSGRQIITVFGAGGNRDKGKRPLMGKIAVKYSDRIIVTSDNPRTEDPRQIIEDILGGLDSTEKLRTLIIPDRSEAIKAAIAMAGPGDVVLVAGKGHENYQIIGTKKKHFDDKEEILKIFNH